MEKANKKIVYVSIAIILILICIMCILPIGQVSAAELELGKLNYDGSDNFCHYSLEIQSIAISGSNGISINRQDLAVNLIGKSCERNIFTTFTYDLNFYLYKGNIAGKKDEALKHIAINFKITDKDQVTNPGVKNAKTIFSVFNLSDFNGGNGDYLIAWDGSISTHISVNVAGSKTISVY